MDNIGRVQLIARDSLVPFRNRISNGARGNILFASKRPIVAKNFLLFYNCSMNLHPIQEKLYKIYNENNGEFPTFRKLAKILGVSSTNTVAYHINQLKKRGELNLSKETKGVVRFNLKNLLNLEGKQGVFVLLKNKKPLYVGESKNIKESLLKIVEDCPDFLKESPESVLIAYYTIKNQTERINLKNHLTELFKKNKK